VNGSDQTTGYGAQAWGNFAATAYGFPAVAIIGEQATPTPVVLILGDSIQAGNGNQVGQGPGGLALDNLGIAYANSGAPGMAMQSLVYYDWFRPQLAQYADYIFMVMMRNDLAAGYYTTLPPIQALFLSFVMSYGRITNRIAFGTLQPGSTSTDSWATYANQTPPTWETLRVQLNNWLRDPSSVGAVAQLNAAQSTTLVLPTIEYGLSVERNSDGSTVSLGANNQQVIGTGGRWYTTGANSITTDGIHSTPAGATVQAAAMQAQCAAMFGGLF
jgi:hypothetical protein